MLNCFRKTSCKHERIALDRPAGYCPDCGEYVENKWFITRCSCCGIKQKSLMRKGKVTTDARFCRNCGSDSFVIEELDSISLVNIDYAVVLKQTNQRRKESFIQTWIDENAFVPMKLLPGY